MRDLINILLTIFFIGIFISFLPSLIFIVLIVFGIYWIMRAFRGPRKTSYYNETRTNQEEPIEDQTTYYETRGRINPDVIEAEYTETEEK